MKQHIKKWVIAMTAAGMVVSFGSLAFARGGHGVGGPEMFEKLDGMTDQERLEFLEDKLDNRLEKMTERVELTKGQQVKVRLIFADAQTQLLEIYEQNKSADDKSLAKAEAKAVFKQAKQDVGDILTDDQKAKVKAHHRDRRQQRKGKMLDHLDAKLELSDGQRAKISKIFDDAHAQMKQLREKGKPGRGQGKAAMERSADKIEAVLTADQRVKFAKMRKQREQRRANRHEGKRERKRGAF